MRGSAVNGLVPFARASTWSVAFTDLSRLMSKALVIAAGFNGLLGLARIRTSSVAFTTASVAELPTSPIAFPK